jgi:hypothetical protein
MTIHVSPGRPLARLVVRAATAGQPARALRNVPSYSPPEPGPLRAASLDVHQVELVRRAERVLYGLLKELPDGVEPLPEDDGAVAPDVVVWSPTVCATSRDEAVVALRPRRDHDDALTDVRVLVVATDVVDERVFIEWRLTARFANPCFIDDDLMVEPTGRLVETSGVQVATFRAGRLERVACYYDDLALLEQLVT